MTKNSLTSSETTLKEQKEKCVITNEEEILKEDLFPFAFKNFKIASLQPFFSNATIVDSVKRYNVEGDWVMIYKFTDGKSNISFLVKPTPDPGGWFYLDQSSIESELLEFKNGVKIGMSKEELAGALNIKMPMCDTLLIQEGDLFTYYDFIFDKNKLSKIEITPSE